MIKTIEDKIYRHFRVSNISERGFLHALIECRNAGLSPLFMPAFIDLQLADPCYFGDYFRSVSIIATGKTKGGSLVQIYAHIPGEWTDVDYISAKIKKGTEIYGLPIPQTSFDSLVSRDGDIANGTRLVTVLDNKLKQYRSCVTGISEILEHPHFIPFFGSEERALKYIKANERRYVSNRYYMFFRNSFTTEPEVLPLIIQGGDPYSYYGFHEHCYGIEVVRYLYGKGEKNLD